MKTLQKSRMLRAWVATALFTVVTVAPNRSGATMSEGGYMTWGVIGAVVTVILGIGAINAYSSGEKLEESAYKYSQHYADTVFRWKNSSDGRYYSDFGKALKDESNAQFTKCLWLSLGAVGSGLLSAAAFNQASEQRRAFLTLEDGRMAMGVPEMRIDIMRGSMETNLVAVRF